MPIQVGAGRAYSTLHDTPSRDAIGETAMRTTAISLNPFSLMMEPEVVLEAMERSESLHRLRRRTLHPLDKPLIPYVVKPALDDTDLSDAPRAAQVRKR